MKDDICGTYNTNSQMKFKDLVLNSSSCDYSDVNILVSGTITANYKRHWRSNANSSIQYGGIGIFPPETLLVLGYWKVLSAGVLKPKIYKDFEVYQVSMYNAFI